MFHYGEKKLLPGEYIEHQSIMKASIIRKLYPNDCIFVNSTNFYDKKTLILCRVNLKTDETAPALSATRTQGPLEEMFEPALRIWIYLDSKFSKIDCF